MPKFFPSLCRHDMQRSGKSSCILVAHESLKACASIRLLSRNDPAQTVADVSVPKSQRMAADATACVRTNMFDDICTTNNQIVRGPACGVRPTPCLAKQVLFLDASKLSLRYLGPVGQSRAESRTWLPALHDTVHDPAASLGRCESARCASWTTLA